MVLALRERFTQHNIFGFSPKILQSSFSFNLLPVKTSLVTFTKLGTSANQLLIKPFFCVQILSLLQK